MSALVESRLGSGVRPRQCVPIIHPPGSVADLGRLHTDGSCEALSCVWPLTRYGRDDGSVCYVPGSHRLRRFPGPGEGTDEVVVVEASPGDLVAFDGFLWHGTWPRSTPEDRLAAHFLFAR